MIYLTCIAITFQALFPALLHWSLPPRCIRPHSQYSFKSTIRHPLGAFSALLDTGLMCKRGGAKFQIQTRPPATPQSSKASVEIWHGFVSFFIAADHWPRTLERPLLEPLTRIERAHARSWAQMVHFFLPPYTFNIASTVENMPL